MAKNYHDLLWDFTLNGAGQTKLAQLRVFSSEQELYEAAKSSAQSFPVELPLDWLSTIQTSRAEWTRTQISTSMLLEFGHRLWDSIPQEAKQPLVEATLKRPCRLKISGNSPTIDDLPWEWLNNGESPAFALRPEIRLVRSVPIRLAAPPLSLEPPLRILLVITNPKDEEDLDIERETQAIRSQLNSKHYKVKVLVGPTWDLLIATLQKEPTHIVHYIGHAGIDRGEGNLLLHDENHMTAWVCGTDLAQALPLTVWLICLSTCFTVPNYQILGLSRLAHTSVMNRMPTVVVNQYPVAEDSVRVFWKSFYTSLIKHHGNINEAFHKAQQTVAITSATEADWGSFSLVIRDQSGKPMRIQTKPTNANEQYAEEIQAQLASRLANDMAQHVIGFSENVPETIQKQYEDEVTKASARIKKLR